VLFLSDPAVLIVAATNAMIPEEILCVETYMPGETFINKSGRTSYNHYKINSNIASGGDFAAQIE